MILINLIRNLKTIFVLIKFYICVILLDGGLHINHEQIIITLNAPILKTACP